MGSFMSYKNVETLVAGMRYLPDYELHLLSRITPARKTELTALSPQARLVFHNGVSDLEYRSLVGGAVALVSASCDEGFGIPVIEAASLGIPTVISDIEIFREIGGESSIYFDPNEAESFAEAVRSIASNQAWMERSSSALDNARRFNWDQSAAALWSIIRQIQKNQLSA
jgi:glycosyltransferase involved in cell wall biosynthesis